MLRRWVREWGNPRAEYGGLKRFELGPGAGPNATERVPQLTPCSFFCGVRWPMSPPRLPGVCRSAGSGGSHFLVFARRPSTLIGPLAPSRFAMATPPDGCGLALRAAVCRGHWTSFQWGKQSRQLGGVAACGTTCCGGCGIATIAWFLEGAGVGRRAIQYDGSAFRGDLPAWEDQLL